ncbi:hypothetical protein I6N96_10905 [Enterococcus sp. BWM-S5]|uniref:Uncharacterized protein n=1 Tax=Enterococcus larvae TaxID=2794352 RepID=A0ABS4CJY1_9ENTE|nr:hypothetical protein [Enterococcus larvae]MBP1046775.1 hypothetical protein [Enterococcus larvae]
MNGSTKVFLKGKFKYSNSVFNKTLVNIFSWVAIIIILFFAIKIMNEYGIVISNRTVAAVLLAIHVSIGLYLTGTIYEKIFEKDILITGRPNGNGLTISINNKVTTVDMNEIDKVKVSFSHEGYRSKSKSSKLVIYTSTGVFHFTTERFAKEFNRLEEYINKVKKRLLLKKDQ